MECTYEEMRRDPAVVNAVEDSLLAEQGELCAYTGIRIAKREDKPSFHLEHLRPQRHCSAGQDTDYGNLVACWPRPNCTVNAEYGARKKDHWPSPAEEHLFLSPLREGCGQRIVFNRMGEVQAVSEGDSAAKETIARLGLDHPELTELRRKEIEGALRSLSGNSALARARKLRREMQQDLAALQRGEAAQLMPFCFAIERALERRIKQLEAIQAQR